MLSRPVVAAEGAACLDLRPPKRPGIEDKPAPSGNVNDRDFFIVCTCQRRSPPFLAYAAVCFSTLRCLLLTDKAAPGTSFAMMTCPEGRIFARSSTDSILSTNTG